MLEGTGVVETAVDLECKSEELSPLLVASCDSPSLSPAALALPKLNLSRSAGAVNFSPTKRLSPGNLSNSCFASLCGNKGSDNDDLTSLSWLQDTNLLKGLCTSPVNQAAQPNKISKGLSSSAPNKLLSKALSFDDRSDCSDDLSLGPPRDSSLCKPPYSFSSLIFMAVESSCYKRLPVKDIYAWIVDHFPYFKSAPLGWKNSVRHNLSLNKCFKKVDKNKTQNIGKGSLWCIDPEYRPSLVQALRKTPAFHSYPFSTPPPSPLGSPRGSLYNAGYSGKFKGDFVHDAEELNAAVAICSMSARGLKRGQNFNKKQEDINGSPVLLNYWRKYIEPLSDDDDEDRHHDADDSGSEGSISESRKRSYPLNPKCNIHTLLTGMRLQSKNHTRNGPNDSFGSWTSDCNDAYTAFSDDDDENFDDDTDDEMEQNMRKLVERDTLADSGYGDTCSSPVMTDHTYTKAAKRSRSAVEPRDLSSLDGVAALLSLADAATQELKGIKASQNPQTHLELRRNEVVA